MNPRLSREQLQRRRRKERYQSESRPRKLQRAARGLLEQSIGMTAGGVGVCRSSRGHVQCHQLLCKLEIPEKFPLLAVFWHAWLQQRRTKRKDSSEPDHRPASGIGDLTAHSAHFGEKFDGSLTDAGEEKKSQFFSPAVISHLETLGREKKGGRTVVPHGIFRSTFNGVFAKLSSTPLPPPAVWAVCVCVFFQWSAMHRRAAAV